MNKFRSQTRLRSDQRERSHRLARRVLVHVAAGHQLGSAGAGRGPPVMGQRVALSGANEVPPVATNAAGTGLITINADQYRQAAAST